VAGVDSAVIDMIEPVVAATGLHLYDVVLAGAAGKGQVLRVLVDRPDGSPVSLDAVTAATQAVSPVLDEYEAQGGAVVKGRYTLEVSSPGLERPLRRAEHWRGAIGSEVSVKTRTATATSRSRGTVLDADADGADLDVGGVTERVAYDDVVQAHTVFDWGTPDKRSTSGAGKNKTRSGVTR
jgi:ribosome maturation factor RimP